MKGSVLELTVDNLEAFPIPNLSDSIDLTTRLESLVDEIQNLVSENPQDSFQFKQVFAKIDDLVFEAYKLDQGERDAIFDTLVN